MFEVADRVALNEAAEDTEGGAVQANEVGMVFGHLGQLNLVELDHGETYVGGKRVVVCQDRQIRRVRVAHPGKKGRSRPRRES